MKHLKFALCLFALASLVASPFFGFALGGPHSPPVGVASGIFASLATNCTLFASATGDDTVSGTDRWDPLTLYGDPYGSNPASPTTPLATSAAGRSKPGDVICLLSGRYELTDTFCPPNSGNATLGKIVYQAYGDGPVLFIYTPPSTYINPQIMIQVGGGGDCPAPSPQSYLEFRGLTLEGQAAQNTYRGVSSPQAANTALGGFFCQGTGSNPTVPSHHISFIGNIIRNTAGSGIATLGCDYLISDHNIINHNGYIPAGCNGCSWTSGISYNDIPWADSYDGLHNVISNNIIVGEVDQSIHHSDGNGIILDQPDHNPPFVGTPPSLVINNVIYGNGGHCIVTFMNPLSGDQVTNFWIVNNTCKKNDLDLTEPHFGQFTTNGSADGYYFNNISYVWSSTAADVFPYGLEGTPSNINYFFNQYYGRSDNACCKNFSPQAFQNFFLEDPNFVNPPYVHPTADLQYSTARPPSENPPDSGLALNSGSPAYNQGKDPTTYCNQPYYCATTAMTPNLLRDMQNNSLSSLYTDFLGHPRPGTGGSWDLGAYQH